MYTSSPPLFLDPFPQWSPEHSDDSGERAGARPSKRRSLRGVFQVLFHLLVRRWRPCEFSPSLSSTEFSNTTQLITSGKLRAHFDQTSKIDILDLITSGHNEYLPRNTLQFLSDPPDLKPQINTPKVSNKRLAQQRQKQQLQAQQEQSHIQIPESLFSPYGVTHPVAQFLEVNYIRFP